MEINFITREEIIDRYLEKVFHGYVLTKEDKEFILHMSNGS